MCCLEFNISIRKIPLTVSYSLADSTRSIYEKKLAKVLGLGSPNSSVLNGSSLDAADSNGSGLKNGEFSADEEVTEEEDESQPSIVVRKAATPLRFVGALNCDL